MPKNKIPSILLHIPPGFKNGKILFVNQQVVISSRVRMISFKTIHSISSAELLYKQKTSGKMYRFQMLRSLIFMSWLFFWLAGCKQSHKNSTDSPVISESPSLSAKESMKLMHIENGFVVELVAEEPLVSAPVAMNFDKQGRLWVVEMENYMPDTLGTGENNPTGKIVILSDKNGDGLMDERRVFLDSLVLPRAICLIENGILVAESPRLWFYEIKNDHPVKRILVDSAYAIGGNVEHQPNSLFRAMDNWIYSGESDKRYIKKGEK